MTVLPLAEVRAQLSRLVESAGTTHERVEITRNGRRAAVLLGADDYDALVETIAVLADAELVRDHLAGLAAGSSGDVLEGAALEDALERHRARAATA